MNNNKLSAGKRDKCNVKKQSLLNIKPMISEDKLIMSRIENHMIYHVVELMLQFSILEHVRNKVPDHYQESFDS